MTYKESKDKIIAAYFNNEIEPYEMEFCFCGTLAYDNYACDWSVDFYTKRELKDMEKALLQTIKDETVGEICDMYGLERGNRLRVVRNKIQAHPNYETALFNGMVNALEVLKQIHINKGEEIEEEEDNFNFQKRKEDLKIVQ
jgi:hypothetical protein